MAIKIFHRFHNNPRQRSLMKPAGLRDRIMAQLIDGIILGALIGIILFLFSRGRIFSVWISPMFPLFLLQKVAEFPSQAGNWWWGGYYVSLSLPYVATVHFSYPAPLQWLVYVSYYSFFHRGWGQTPGKMLKGLVVMSESQQKINWSTAILRWFYYLISGIPLGWGFWRIGWDPARRGWHDLLAHSRVWKFFDPENPE